jgi:plasmid maintenance system antidote protein VapI
MTADMAVRLERLLGTPSAEMWMRMQDAVALWESRQHVAGVEPLAA